MMIICRAEPPDGAAILSLQTRAYQSEAKIYNDWSLPPLRQSLDSLIQEIQTMIVLKAISQDRIVGSVRGSLSEGVCAIGRLIVDPAAQREGIGTRLMKEIEAAFPKAIRYELFTGSKSEGNIRLYLRLGYSVVRTETVSPSMSLVFMQKPAFGGGLPRSLGSWANRKQP